MILKKLLLSYQKLKEIILAIIKTCKDILTKIIIKISFHSLKQKITTYIYYKKIDVVFVSKNTTLGAIAPLQRRNKNIGIFFKKMN
ncbi:hypothetical protein PNEG_04341 [Pneumocystis murina B123]|uniref:Uncharacterized protein n=1 Tax=Pneumocystis murina (strain B123) TaxID=1069680 RepID=A0A0W4ZWT8_PNEMU|nr:hypothetical protein PNEG_04341 [Pneumocystis murina B123]KTW32840.1 hypothetical protein PNEG_04341 [Pneumocystis murina B123]